MKDKLRARKRERAKSRTRVNERFSLLSCFCFAFVLLFRYFVFPVFIIGRRIVVRIIVFLLKSKMSFLKKNFSPDLIFYPQDKIKTQNDYDSVVRWREK